MDKSYFLGIDIGTFESKGMLMDGQGVCVATHSVPHLLQSPQTGFAEHDAEKDWWGDFCAISNRLIRDAGVPPERILGVGCSGIGPCCLPVDTAGKPLRNAILYGVDVRAGKEIAYLNEKLGEDAVLKKYGNPITSQSIGPKILWIKNNEPEIYDKTAKFVTSTTYLVAKLTGEYFIDHYTAAYFTPMYDLLSCDWDFENLAEFCRADQLPQCRWTNEIVGTVTPEAARQTGLAVGTPVSTGTADAAADAVAVGVCDPGDMLLMFGSSVYMIHVVPKLTTDPRFWAGPYLFKDTYMVASGMSTSGTLTRWFRDNLAVELVERERQGGENAYDALIESVEQIPCGSDGLITLPYFSGERTPINDTEARGVMFGLTINHTRAHLYQSCLEGVAYGIAQHFDGYSQIGMQTEKVVAVGGGTKNPKWMQIVADVTGKELMIGGVFGAAYGDAMLCALATGFFNSMRDIAPLVRMSGAVVPDAENTRRYAPFKEMYTRLYVSNKELMHELSRKAKE